MPIINNIEVVPTGGAVSLTFTTVSGGMISLSRAVSGSSTYTQLYSGQPLTYSGIQQYYLDYGDLAPLSPATFYVYKITDTHGSIVSDAVQPTGALTVDSFNLTDIFLRLMQAGLNNIATPSGIVAPTVTFAMPQGGLPPLPYIVIFPVMLQQDAQKIGNDVNLTNNCNQWTINELARYHFQVTILTNNAQQMLFYRDSVIGIFKSIVATVLPNLGQDVSHSYIANASQATGDFANKSPGFFQQDILLEFVGIFNITIQRDYGLIEHIDEKVYSEISDELLVEVLTPPTSPS